MRIGVGLVAVVAVSVLAAVPSTSSRVDYTGNGETRGFAFTFTTSSASSVEVFLGGVKQTSGHTVTLKGSQYISPGGTVTFTTAPAAGVTVRIQRTKPVTEDPGPFSTNGPLWAKTLESELDNRVGEAQQIDRRVADQAVARPARVTAPKAVLAVGTIGGTSTFVTAGGGTAAVRATEVLSPEDIAGAPASETGDDSTEINAALFAAVSGSKIVDGGGRTYRITSSVTVPAGVTLRNASLVAGAAGITLVRVSTGSKVLGVKLTGLGTIGGSGERGIYPATDGASDVELDVEVTNVTIGVHAQPLASLIPARWHGRIYAHNIVGAVGSSEGYGLLLSPAEWCRFTLVARTVERHALYLSTGASYNTIDADIDGVRNAAMQLYSLQTHPVTQYNTVRAKVRNVVKPADQPLLRQSAGVILFEKVAYNTITLDMDGGGTAEHAVWVHGSDGAGYALPSYNRIINCNITGAFLGEDVIRDMNGNGTIYADNTIHAYGTQTVIALRRSGFPTLRVLGPVVERNRIDAQGQTVTGVYDEVNNAPTFVGLNDIRNNGIGDRVGVESGSLSSRRGYSREYIGQCTTTSLPSNSAGTCVENFPEPIAGARVSATVTGFSVTGTGQYPAYASSVTSTSAHINAFNGAVSPQTLTIDFVIRGD